MLLITLALAAPAWSPVWSGAVDAMGSSPHVELLGMSETGDTAWLRVGEGPRRTHSLWQIDLDRGRRTGVWTASSEEPSPTFGALSPLVADPSDLNRYVLLQAHIAGRATWPDLSLDPLGRWLAWEHGDERGNDVVTVRTEDGASRLGEEGLAAVYRPRFHPTAPWVAYAASSPRGAYEVVVESLETGERRSVAGLGHASQLDWDAAGALWITGEGCVHRLPADRIRFDDAPSPEAEVVACGSEDLHTRMSPDGGHIVVVDHDPDDDQALLVGRFRTDDAELDGHIRVPGGRSAQGLSDDGWLLLTTRRGTVLVPVGADGRAVALDVPAIGAVHDHWAGGRTVAMVWDPIQRVVTLGWVQPPTR